MNLKVLFIALYLFAIGFPLCVFADERLRIVGMGGTRIATRAADAGIFGNPASLVRVQNHNIAFGLAAENLHWTETNRRNLPVAMLLSDREQFTAEVGIDVYPAVYYSHAFGKWGISIGYAAAFTNTANFTLSATRAEYDTNNRRFSAQTDLNTDYALFREGRWMLCLARQIGQTVTGARFKWIRQNVRRGTLVSTLNLAARHGAEVDARTPAQFIPAIVEALEFGDRVRDIIHNDYPEISRTTGRLEFDVGFHRDFQLSRLKPIRVGILFENLLRADVVEPLPFRLGIGIAHEPLDWIVLAADVSRATGEGGMGKGGIDYALGAEFHTGEWKTDFAAALRIGTSRVAAIHHFSMGIALTLGTLSTAYTLRSPFTSISMIAASHLASHLLALTLHW